MHKLKTISDRPKRVAVVGDVMLDVHVHCEVTGISPEDDIAPKLRIREETYRPGGAGNVALNLKSLGLVDEVYLFGAVGIDAEGEMIKCVIEGAGINFYGSQCSDRYTTTKTRYLTNRGKHICRVDRESTYVNMTVCRDIEMSMAEVGAFDAIIVSDYGKGVVTYELMNFLHEFICKKYFPIIVDPKGDNFEKYGSVYAVTPNQKEFAGVLREEYDDNTYSLRCLSEHVILTRGHMGCSALSFDHKKNFVGSYVDRFGLIPARVREVGDPTGCGDSFLAGFTSKLVSLWGSDQLNGTFQGLQMACCFANAVGACAYDHQGARSVTMDEVEKELKTFDYYKENT